MAWYNRRITLTRVRWGVVIPLLIIVAAGGYAVYYFSTRSEQGEAQDTLAGGGSGGLKHISRNDAPDSRRGKKVFQKFAPAWDKKIEELKTDPAKSQGVRRRAQEYGQDVETRFQKEALKRLDSEGVLSEQQKEILRTGASIPGPGGDVYEPVLQLGGFKLGGDQFLDLGNPFKDIF
jgi:hypothetical protein